MKLIIEIDEDIVTKVKDNAMFAETIASQIKWGVTSAIVNAKPLDDLRAEIYEEFMTIDGGVHDESAIKCMKIIDKYKVERVKE